MSTADLLDRIERKFVSHELSIETHLGKWLVSLLQWIASEDCPGWFGMRRDVEVYGTMPGFPPMPGAITNLANPCIFPNHVRVHVSCGIWEKEERRWFVVIDFGSALEGDSYNEKKFWGDLYPIKETDVVRSIQEHIPNIVRVKTSYDYCSICIQLFPVPISPA